MGLGSIDSILKRMHSQDATDKGTTGEQAVFTICEKFYNEYGGILIHSYAYKTVDGLAGNIKTQYGGFYVENIGGYTEIDILLCTPFKIFPIEVKAYKAKKIILTDDRISGCNVTNKSPIHQNEMHMRHLYPQIFTNIPGGKCYDYVVPIVVFVDRCTVEDNRSREIQDYIPIAILNTLNATITKYNKPVNNTIIDLKGLEQSLRSAMVSNSVFLPYVQRGV